MRGVVNATRHCGAAATARPVCGDGKGDYPAPRSNGPTLHKLSAHVGRQWASWEGARSAWGELGEGSTAAPLLSYLEQRGSGGGVCFLRCFTNSVALQKNSLDPLEPDCNSRPCKLEHKQLKA